MAYWSHFIVKFPQDAYLLVVALLSYGLLMAIHFFIERRQERNAFHIGKSHSIPGLEQFQKVYLVSEVDEQQTKITYSLTMTAVSKEGRELTAKADYDCTKLFDTHGYLHLQQVEEHIVSPCIAKFNIAKKTS